MSRWSHVLAVAEQELALAEIGASVANRYMAGELTEGDFLKQIGDIHTASERLFLDMVRGFDRATS